MAYFHSDTNDNASVNDCLVVPQPHVSLYGWLICGPVLTTFILTGFVGNSVYISFLLRNPPISVLNIYTILICFCDCAVLSGAFLTINLPLLISTGIFNSIFYVRALPMLIYLSKAALTGTVWLVIALSVERCFAMCYPFKHMLYNARKRSVRVTCICVLCAFVYNAPRFFEFRVTTCRTDNRTTIYRLEESQRKSNGVYHIIYNGILGKVLLSIGPFVFLCFLSIRMWKHLRRNQDGMYLRQLLSYHPELEPKPDLELEVKPELRPEPNLEPELKLEPQPSTPKSNTPSMDIPLSDLLLNMTDLEHATDNCLANRCDEQGEWPPKLSTAMCVNKERRLLRLVRSDKKRANSLTFTLLLVIFKFLLCHTLQIVMDLWESSTPFDADFKMRPTRVLLVNTSNLFVVINSSLTGVLCIWGNRRLRRRLTSSITSYRGGSN